MSIRNITVDQNFLQTHNCESFEDAYAAVKQEIETGNVYPVVLNYSSRVLDCWPLCDDSDIEFMARMVNALVLDGFLGTVRKNFASEPMFCIMQHPDRKDMIVNLEQDVAWHVHKSDLPELYKTFFEPMPTNTDNMFIQYGELCNGFDNFDDVPLYYITAGDIADFELEECPSFSKEFPLWFETFVKNVLVLLEKATKDKDFPCIVRIRKDSLTDLVPDNCTWKTFERNLRLAFESGPMFSVDGRYFIRYGRLTVFSTKTHLNIPVMDSENVCTCNDPQSVMRVYRKLKALECVPSIPTIIANVMRGFV